MELRKNQVKPVEIGLNFLRQKKANPSIIVAPTAFGKSIVIAKLAKELNEKLLILQPSKELLEQNFTKYTKLGGVASIYSASFNSKHISSVTYATIGSIKGIGARFKELGFTKMIIDEAHLYPRNADSMLGGFLRDSGITHVLGLTATPLKLQQNSDREGNTFSKLVMLTSRSKLGNFFKDIIYVSQIQEMVDLKFWAKLEYEQYIIDEGKLVFNSTKAEYTEESLRAVYESNDIFNKVVNKVSDLKDRKSILVFVPSVAEAKQLQDVIPNSYAVYSGMPTKERDFVIKGFKNLSIRVIINVNILSVGFDHPELDCIICARPTASLSWLYQALGRLTRIHENKKDGLIVDFSGNVKRFGRIELIEVVKENVWKIYGEGGKLLSGVPMHEIGLHTKDSENRMISEKLLSDVQKAKKDEEEKNKPITMPFGKYAGTELKQIPKGYRDWMLREFKWTYPSSDRIKKELERICQEENHASEVPI
ncbi:MAG: DUF3820 family protein [Thiolinea sp.]